MEAQNKKLLNFMNIKRDEEEIDFLRRIKGLELECSLMIDYISNTKRIESKKKVDNKLFKSGANFSVGVGILEKNYNSNSIGSNKIIEIYNGLWRTVMN